MRLSSLLLLLGSCTTAPTAPIVLGVEIEAAKGRPVRWDKAAAVISECAAKFPDPRVLNDAKVRQYATVEEVGHNCLSMESVACYIGKKDLILLAPRDDHELPAFCHEIGHRISVLRGEQGDPCHLDAKLWAPIDGSTCTCPGRCPKPVEPTP